MPSLSWILALREEIDRSEMLWEENSGHLLDIIDSVRGFDFESDRLARESFNENLHIYLSIY